MYFFEKDSDITHHNKYITQLINYYSSLEKDIELISSFISSITLRRY